MTININSSVFVVGSTGIGKITPGIVSVMNTSPSFIKLFDSISNLNSGVGIAIGAAGKGTFFEAGLVIIDPTDFATYVNDPRTLVARIGHELAHAVDSIKASSIAGADGLTPGSVAASNLSPADYNLGRAKDEGLALYQEFLIAKDLGLRGFSGDGVPGLFAKMDANYTALKAAGLSDAVIGEVMTVVAGSAGRNLKPSTGAGLNEGLNYGQIDIKDFIVSNLGFTDATGKAIVSENYATSNIVGYQQDDNGSFRISAINPTTGQLVSKDYILSRDGKTKILVSTTTDSNLDDSGAGTRKIVYNDGRPEVNQIVDSSGVTSPILPAPRTPFSPLQWFKKQFSEAVDTNGDGIADAILSAAPSALGTDIISIKPTTTGTTNSSPAFESQTYDDGTQLVTVNYPSGIQTIISTDVLGSSKQVDYPVPGDLNIKDITNRDSFGAITSSSSIQPQYDVDANNTVFIVPNSYLLVNRDGQGSITATGQRSTNPVDGSYIDSLLTSATAANPQGSYVQYSTDSQGITTEQNPEVALNNLSFAASQANAAYSLINAIRTNNVLGIASSSLQLANGFTSGQIPELGQLGTPLYGLSSLTSLVSALERGNPGGAILPAANLVNAYALYTIQSQLPGLNLTVSQAAQLDAFGSAGEAVAAISEAIPYLNLANDLANGNYIGAIADGLSIAFPPFAPLFQFVGFVLNDIFAGDPPPIPWASGNAYWDAASNSIQVRTVGYDGDPSLLGNNPGVVSYVRSTLTSITDNLVNITAQYNASAQPGMELGVVTQRLGSLSFNGRNGNLYVNTFDPITGQQLDPNVNFSGVFAGGQTNNSGQSLGSYYTSNALARQAIAPLWEVNTANAQQANNLSNAGLGETERQANLGHLARPAAPTVTSSHYKNRSCLRPNLLGYSTKTCLKTARNCSKRASTSARNKNGAQKLANLGSKSSLFMGISSY